MKNEVQVNLKDLIIYLMKQWKLYVVAGLVGAVLMCGVYAFLNAGKDVPETGTQGDAMESLKQALTEQEISEVEEAVRLYLINLEHYEELKTYVTESLISQIHVTSTPTYEIVYSISGVTMPEDERIIYEVLTLVENGIKSETTIAALQNALDLDVNPVYIKELIDIELVENSSTFLVNVVAPNKELCEGLGKELKGILSTRIEEVASRYTDVQIKNLDEVYFEEMNRSLQTLQFDLYNRLNNTNTLLGRTYYELTSDQEAYYDALIQEAEQEDKDENTEDESVAVNGAPSLSSYLKMAILGAVAAVFVGVVFEFMRYLLTDTLKTKEDLSETFHQHVFCDLFAKELQESSDAFALLKENICFAGSKHEVKKLLIAGTSSEKTVQQCKESIQKACKDAFESIEVITIAKDDLEAVRQIQQCDGMICVEKIGKSSYTAIEKEIKLSTYYEVPLLGFVVVK